MRAAAVATRGAGQRRPKRDPFSLVVQDRFILSDGSPSTPKPEHLFKDPSDGSLYVVYSLGSGTPTKIAKSTTGHPFGPYAAATTVVASMDSPYLLASGGNYYIFGGGIAGTGVTMWRSTTLVTGPYTSLGVIIAPGQVAYSDGATTSASTSFASTAAVFTAADTGKTITGPGIPAATTMTFVDASHVTLSSAATATATGVTFQILGRTGAWNIGRATEPWVFFDTISAQWVMFYMGFTSGEVKEQIGIATAPAVEGPWTVRGAAPVIPVGTVIGDLDYDVVADPFVMVIGGVYYCFYVAGRNASKANSSPYNYALATSPDLVTWTKQGRVLERPAWPAMSSVATWRGQPYLYSDGNYYFPRAGAAVRCGATGAAYNLMMDVVHPESFRNGLPTNAWVRVQSEAASTRTGTGWTLLSNIALDGPSPGRSYYSAVAGDTVSYTFTGQGIRWGTVARDNCGQAEVRVDGILLATVDLYVNDATGFSPCHGFEAVGLENKSHTITVTVLGTKTAAATGANIHADYFEYLP